MAAARNPAPQATVRLVSGPGADAYWKRFGEVFPALKKELLRMQLFTGDSFQVRRRAISVATSLTDAICESEGLDFLVEEPQAPTS